jgi:hypothetical protein
MFVEVGAVRCSKEGVQDRSVKSAIFPRLREAEAFSHRLIDHRSRLIEYASSHAFPKLTFIDMKCTLHVPPDNSSNACECWVTKIVLGCFILSPRKPCYVAM